MAGVMDKIGGTKYWFSFGAAGLVAGHLLIYELPAQRKDATERELRAAEREDRRADKVEKVREAGIAHGQDAITTLATKLEGLTKSVDRNTESFLEVQSITHKNQQKSAPADAGLRPTGSYQFLPWS